MIGDLYFLLILFNLLIIQINSNLLNEVIVNKSEFGIPNYCNNSLLFKQSGLIRAPMGQFLGFPCSSEFYHCHWQSDGYRTFRKNCRTGLVYDVFGTQNCNYDYNVKGCSTGPGDNSVAVNCTVKDFKCPLSEDCVPLSKRCDGNYDCVLEEDEQNCPMCKSIHFPCVVSEQCIPIGQRCNGIKECDDGTDELDCENCGSGNFFCRKSGKCIPAKERCDGYAQCPNGEDEQLCKKSPRNAFSPNMFLCESGTQQISQKQVCDGIVHCTYDGSDEKYCQRSTGNERPRNEIEFETNLNIQPKEPLSNENEIVKVEQNSNVAFDQPPQLSVEGFQPEKDQNVNTKIIQEQKQLVDQTNLFGSQNLPHINSIAFEFEKPKRHEKMKNIENFNPENYQTDIWNESQLNSKDLPSNSERFEDNKNLTQQEQIEQNNLILVQEQEKQLLSNNEEVLTTNIEKPTPASLQQIKHNVLLKEEKEQSVNNKEEIEKFHDKIKNIIKNDLLNEYNITNCKESKKQKETELFLNITNEELNEINNSSTIKNEINNITTKIKQLFSSTTNIPLTTIENNVEQDIVQNIAEKLEKMRFIGAENNEEKINIKSGEENNEHKINISQKQNLIEDDENEDEEQRQILKRLYSKYGRRRTKDLLNHLENLLLLVENGNISSNDCNNNKEIVEEKEEHKGEEIINI